MVQCKREGSDKEKKKVAKKKENKNNIWCNITNIIKEFRRLRGGFKQKPRPGPLTNRCKLRTILAKGLNKAVQAQAQMLVL